jgi:hypothetical protein
MRWQAIVVHPSLVDDALPFFLGNFDLMPFAAAAATVTIPILDCRQLEMKTGHESNREGEFLR